MSTLQVGGRFSAHLAGPRWARGPTCAHPGDYYEHFHAPPCMGEYQAERRHTPSPQSSDNTYMWFPQEHKGEPLRSLQLCEDCQLSHNPETGRVRIPQNASAEQVKTYLLANLGAFAVKALRGATYLVGHKACGCARHADPAAQQERISLNELVKLLPTNITRVLVLAHDPVSVPDDSASVLNEPLECPEIMSPMTLTLPVSALRMQLAPRGLGLRQMDLEIVSDPYATHAGLQVEALIDTLRGYALRPAPVPLRSFTFESVAESGVHNRAVVGILLACMPVRRLLDVFEPRVGAFGEMTTLPGATKALVAGQAFYDDKEYHLRYCLRTLQHTLNEACSITLRHAPASIALLTAMGEAHTTGQHVHVGHNLSCLLLRLPNALNRGMQTGLAKLLKLWLEHVVAASPKRQLRLFLQMEPRRALVDALFAALKPVDIVGALHLVFLTESEHDREAVTKLFNAQPALPQDNLSVYAAVDMSGRTRLPDIVDLAPITQPHVV